MKVLDSVSKFSPHGADLFGDPIQMQSSVLGKRYVAPPFDVLDGRSEDWKIRRRAWAALFDSGEGRSGHSAWNSRALSNGLEGWLKKVDNVGARTDFAHGWSRHDMSIFDPVLAEVAISWFSPEGGQIVDPFAGGCVRAYVATALGRKYHGIDLSDRQIEANKKWVSGATWAIGDALEKLDEAPLADLVFTCPPYGTLERYSDDPRELSTMDWDRFHMRLKGVLRKCVNVLKPDGMIAVVVGDYREKRAGRYTALRPLVAAVTEILSVSAELMESAVFLTPIGSLPIRASHNWAKGGKLGRAHQNLIVARRRA